MQMMSENTVEIFTALARAQAKMENVTSNQQGYGYKYAELSQYLNIARDVLAANGLSFCSFFWRDHLNESVIVTMLTHTSGQWIKSVFPIEPEEGNPNDKRKLSQMQAIGSIFTYVRRYVFRGMLNMHDHDDDGKGAKDYSFKGGTKPKVEAPDVVAQLRRLCQDKGINAAEFAQANGVSSTVRTTVEHAVKNFPSLSAKFLAAKAKEFEITAEPIDLVGE